MTAPPGRKRPNRRKLVNLLIQPRYQLRYAFLAAGAGAVLATFNSLVFYRYVKESYDTLVELAPMTDEARARLYRELFEVAVRLGAASMVFTALVAVFAVVMTQRTAGPLYHLRRVFTEMRDGNREARVRLRPNDDFQDVARAFNEAMDAQLGAASERKAS
jgi:methyl-accepting chemotaxis protein